MMTPRLSRIKLAVRAGIALCGHIDGAAATAGRGRTVAGDWHNLSHPAFPPLDCALPLDEVAISLGHAPPILSGYAAELGFACVQLPEREGSAAACKIFALAQALTGSLVEASAEFGDVAGEVRDATRDGVVGSKDSVRVIAAIDQALHALVRMRSIVADAADTS